MKKKIILLAMSAIMLLSTAMPALAAIEWYDFNVPGTGTVLAPGARVIWNGRAIDAQHKFSGGKNVSFRIKRAADNVALGTWIIVSPQQRKRLWNNATGINVNTRVEAATPWYEWPVTVRAQGNWIYNF